ncbi:MAG: hypothetical protein RLZZ131_259, partial [Actinomycetota bacterium]
MDNRSTFVLAKAEATAMMREYGE